MAEQVKKQDALIRVLMRENDHLRADTEKMRNELASAQKRLHEQEADLVARDETLQDEAEVC